MSILGTEDTPLPADDDTSHGRREGTEHTGGRPADEALEEATPGEAHRHRPRQGVKTSPVHLPLLPAIARPDATLVAAPDLLSIPNYRSAGIILPSVRVCQSAVAYGSSRVCIRFEDGDLLSFREVRDILREESATTRLWPHPRHGWPDAVRKQKAFVAERPGDLAPVDTMHLTPLPGVGRRPFRTIDVVSR